MKPELQASNRDSWRRLAVFINDLPDDTSWRDWKRLLGPVVEAASAAGLDRYFRAGQSMSHLIFSAMEEHGLESPEPMPPRVTLGLERDCRLFVAYSHKNLWFHAPERKHIVTPESALSVLRSYLSELWCVAHPAEPLPEMVADPGIARGR